MIMQHIREKIRILKRGAENLERVHPKIRFTYKPLIASIEMSYGNSNNLVIGPPLVPAVIYTYMDKKTALIFRGGKTVIDNIDYYLIQAPIFGRFFFFFFLVTPGFIRNKMHTAMYIIFDK